MTDMAKLFGVLLRAGVRFRTQAFWLPSRNPIIEHVKLEMLNPDSWGSEVVVVFPELPADHPDVDTVSRASVAYKRDIQFREKLDDAYYESRCSVFDTHDWDSPL